MGGYIKKYWSLGAQPTFMGVLRTWGKFQGIFGFIRFIVFNGFNGLIVFFGNKGIHKKPHTPRLIALLLGQSTPIKVG